MTPQGLSAAACIIALHVKNPLDPRIQYSIVYFPLFVRKLVLPGKDNERRFVLTSTVERKTADKTRFHA